MALYKNKAYSIPYEINQRGNLRDGNALKIGQDSRKLGLKVTNEILFKAYEMMQYPAEGETHQAYVIAPPEIIQKNQIVNFTSYNNTSDATDSAVEYLKVYARIPKEHMTVGLPSAFIQAGDLESQTPVPSQKSIEYSEAHKVMHPYFLMPLNAPADGSPMTVPQVGDRLEVIFADSMKTHGSILGISQSGIGVPQNLDDLLTSAPAAFDLFKQPIEAVFKADKGPVATLAANPHDVSGMATGKDVKVGTGESIKTIVFDGKLIDARTAPNLAAMFRDAATEGVDLAPLTSGFRVGFIEDNLTPDEINSYTVGKVNWDGNPYPKYKYAGASQEKLRYHNCGPTKGKDDGDLRKGQACRIATGLPVKPGTWAGKKKSGHMMGNGVDVRVGSWGGQPSSKHSQARPDLMTKEYRWLCLNAYKYGFIRTVPSERWHWEFLPGKNQFSRVSRRNALWDNQFTGDLAQYQ